MAQRYREVCQHYKVGQIRGTRNIGMIGKKVLVADDSSAVVTIGAKEQWMREILSGKSSGRNDFCPEIQLVQFDTSCNDTQFTTEEKNRYISGG